MATLSGTKNKHKHKKTISHRVRRSVLVLDDDPLVRWSLGRALRKAGFAVKTAESGEDALRLLEVMHFDAVLTDMELPRIDGLTVASAIRCREKEILIIMITASEYEAVRKQAATLGINHVVEKPFDLGDVISLVKELLPALSRS